MLASGKRAVLLLLPFLLFACQKQPKPPEFFLLNSEYIQPVYDQCVSSQSTSDQHAMECVAVMTVIPLFKQYLSELMSNSALYGLKIMQAQIHLVELQKKKQIIENQLSHLSSFDDQYQKLQAQHQQLQQDVKRQELQVNSRRAVLRLLHSGSL